MTIDNIVRDFFVSVQSPSSNIIFTAISASVYILLALTLIIVVRNFIINKKDTKFANLIIGAAILWAVIEALKFFIPRERPDGSDNESFPSRHAALGFFTAYFLPAEKKYKILAYAWAILIAVSRLAINVHWLSDVIVGSLIGWSFAYAINKIDFGKLMNFLKKTA